MARQDRLAEIDSNSSNVQPEVPQSCLHQLFEIQVAKDPDAIAVSDGDKALRYGELNRQANQLARHLRALGVGANSLVGLCVERSLDAIVGMLGILKAGGAYVPLDPAYPSDRLSYMVKDTRIAVLVTTAALQTALGAVLGAFGGKAVYLDRDSADIAAQSWDNVNAAVSPHNLMYVIYTSGSTGKPKGIMVTHGNVVRLFYATQSYLSFDKNDRWTLFHSYSFGFSVWEIWGALFHGAELVIVRPEVGQSPDDFYRLVAQKKITVLSQTPSAFSLFLLADAASKQNLKLSLRYIVFSGEALDPVLLDSWMARHGDAHPQLVNMYAITETAGEITYRRLTSADVTQAGNRVIGIPLPDVHIYILDEDGQPVSAGAAGEMYVSSSAVALGYLNLPALTAQKFLPDPSGQSDGRRMYRTGDRARYLPNGEIEFLGRADDQVKIRGYRIELAEIQSVLLRHPAIFEACVVARTDASNHTRLFAYVVPRSASLAAAENAPSAELDTQEVQAYLKSTLPEYMIPAAVVKLDSLPRSPNGKIDRQMLPNSQDEAPAQSSYIAKTDEEIALAQMWGLLSPQSPAASAPRASMSAAKDQTLDRTSAPQTPIEQTVAQIWSKLLSISRVGRHDDFLAIGGNSLLAAQVLYRINDEFHVNLSMRQLLDTGTVAGLAELITLQQATQVETADLADLLADLADISEEEAKQRLSEQMNKVSAPRDLPAEFGTEAGAQSARHQAFMRSAIVKAEEAIAEDQTPIAACIVKDGELLACVYNEVRRHTDVTAHAEVQAIRAACSQLQTTDLSGCVLYSTLEPCPMCFFACEWASISTIVYGARRSDAEKFGLGGPAVSVRASKELSRSRIDLVEDVLRDENLRVFQSWQSWLRTRGAPPAQYDPIAQQFRKIRSSAVNKHITDYTLFAMIGELAANRTVLDLACGEGHYCRLLKQRGAARVVGVDISTQMIRLAEWQEKQNPRDIEYVCKDVLELGKVGEFDLVVASFLLNYAQTKEQLLRMCQVAFENLKPGGHFVLLNEHIERSQKELRTHERYGYFRKIAEPCEEGSIITHTVKSSDEIIEFHGYYWSKETYESALLQAGFQIVKRQNLLCSPQSIEEYGQRFWEDFLQNPPFRGIVCKK